MLKITGDWSSTREQYRELSDYNADSYMGFVESVVKNALSVLHIAEKVVLKVSDGYKVTYSNTKDEYTLHVPKEEIENKIIGAEGKIDVATNILHEVGHIYNEDPKYFTWVDKSPMWSKRNRALCALAETRADIFANKYANQFYNNASFNWVFKGGDYKKDGYFKGELRVHLAKLYPTYNKTLVQKLFFGIMQKDGFISYDEITNSVYHDLRLSKGKKDWMKKLLFMSK